MKKTMSSAILALILYAAPVGPAASAAVPLENAAPESPASFDMAKVARFGFGNILMGGWTPHDGWVSADQLQGSERFHSLRIWGGEQCRIFGLNGMKGEGIISAIHSEHPDESSSAMPKLSSFDLHTPEGIIKEPSGLLAMVCPWDVQPRKVTVMRTGNAIYQGIVKKYLASLGLTDEEPNLVQLFKIDLEGDGVDEVLVCAQNIAGKGEINFEADLPLITGTGLPMEAKKGAYSVLFLRKVAGGNVLELPLHEYVAPQGSAHDGPDWRPPAIAKVCQFSDLNGDGILEIITATAFNENYTYHVFEVKGDKAHEALTWCAGN